MQIEESNTTSTECWALFALGFRPFFLAAGFSAIALMVIWLVMQNSSSLIQVYYPITSWHTHEMLFGYVVAVIAGFLLTAVRNWTDLPTATGTVLLLMVLLWLSARILPLLSNVIPGVIIAIVDLSFLVGLTWSVAIRVLKRRQFSNMIFILILLLMLFANVLVHTEALSITHNTAGFGIYAMLFLVLMLIVVMGGRVIPFFAERGVLGLTTKKWKWIEWLAAPSIVFLGFSILFYEGMVTWIALAAMLIHLVRWVGWYSHTIWQEPLVWILLLAYAWIIVGLGLVALAYGGYLNVMLAWHALVVGGIGSITLGMMTRVALGHTGRVMSLPRGMVFGFVLINITAVVRVFMPALYPEYHLLWINLSGALWIFTFLMFVVIYWPILSRARIDGRPG